MIPFSFSDLEVFQDCGGNYTNATGILTSPSYPNSYPRNTDCVYIISQPSGTFINLTIETFDVEARRGCLFDFIEIRDGADPDSYRLGKFCGSILGSDIPTSIQSIHQNMRIRY